MIVHDIVHDNTTTTTRSSHVSIESVPGPWMWGLDSAEAAIGAAGSSTQRYPSFVWNRDHWWSDLINQDLGIKNYQKECNYTQFKPQHYSSWPHCAFIFRYRSVGVGKARKWVFVVALFLPWVEMLVVTVWQSLPCFLEVGMQRNNMSHRCSKFVDSLVLEDSLWFYRLESDIVEYASAISTAF